MNITATHINYYLVCKRKLWLFSNQIQMENNSDLVTEGKLIGENTYNQRPEKYVEIEIDNIKIDFYDAKNKVIHEIKKSNKIEAAHEAQVKYYILRLRQMGIENVKGILEYPTLRITKSIELHDNDIEMIRKWEEEISEITENTEIPVPINKSICKKCSYFEFCYC
jgi:CRISPR-associated exonuclease Cas4